MAETRLSTGILTGFEKDWHQRSRGQRARFWTGTGVFVAVALAAAWSGRVDPLVLVRDSGHIVDYFRDCLPTLGWATFGADLRAWFWGLGRWSAAILDTVLIAILATVVSAVLAFGASFAASKNLVPGWVYWISRRFLELCRGVPELLYALLFVQAFGLGALPGVLAIVVHCLGSLGKLFAEVNESAQMGEWEGVRAAGGNWAERIRFGIVPQVLPNLASYTILRFEINIRAATVIGFVGAGGIGMHLMTAIRSFQYQDISAIILMILVVVVVLDRVSEALRFRLIGQEARS